jgi:hypothetical protein
MSQLGEIIPDVAGNMLSIADMPPWHFWAKAESLDSTTEESLALSRNEISFDRVMVLRLRVQSAFNYLRDVKPAGAKEWMAARRMMN